MGKLRQEKSGITGLGKPIATGSRLVVARAEGWGLGGDGQRTQGFFWGEGMMEMS